MLKKYFSVIDSRRWCMDEYLSPTGQNGCERPDSSQKQGVLVIVSIVGLYSPIGNALECEASVMCSIHSSGELKCALRGPTTCSDPVGIMDQGRVTRVNLVISITLLGSSFPIRLHNLNRDKRSFIQLETYCDPVVFIII